jgi:hypothetical protein
LIKLSALNVTVIITPLKFNYRGAIPKNDKGQRVTTLLLSSLKKYSDAVGK